MYVHSSNVIVSKERMWLQMIELFVSLRIVSVMVCAYVEVVCLTCM